MIPERFAPRLARLRAVLARHDCAAMLIDHAELLAWISGYTVSQTMYRAAIVPQQGDPCFVLRALDAAPCRAATWFPEVIAFADDEDPHACVAHALTMRGLAAVRIGVDADSYGFTAATAERLRRLLPMANFVDLGPVSDTLRDRKFPDEITTLRRAAGIADATMAVLATQARPACAFAMSQRSQPLRCCGWAPMTAAPDPSCAAGGTSNSCMARDWTTFCPMGTCCMWS